MQTRPDNTSCCDSETEWSHSEFKTPLQPRNWKPPKNKLFGNFLGRLFQAMSSHRVGENNTIKTMLIISVYYFCHNSLANTGRENYNSFKWLFVGIIIKWKHTTQSIGQFVGLRECGLVVLSCCSSLLVQWPFSDVTSSFTQVNKVRTDR